VRWAKRTKYIEIDFNCEIRLCYTWHGTPYIAFHFVNHFHRFHLKRIRNWHASNHMHFTGLLSNQSQFLVMFKFFVHIAFHLAYYFYRFHLKRIRNWHALNLELAGRQISHWLLSHGVFRSLPAMHFALFALSRWLSQMTIQNSEHETCAASSARAIYSSKGFLRYKNWQRMRRKRCPQSLQRNWIEGDDTSLTC
jgi:hypothetical protein